MAAARASSARSSRLNVPAELEGPQAPLGPQASQSPRHPPFRGTHDAPVQPATDPQLLLMAGPESGHWDFDIDVQQTIVGD